MARKHLVPSLGLSSPPPLEHPRDQDNLPLSRRHPRKPPSLHSWGVALPPWNPHRTFPNLCCEAHSRYQAIGATSNVMASFGGPTLSRTASATPACPSRVLRTYSFTLSLLVCTICCKTPPRFPNTHRHFWKYVEGETAGAAHSQVRDPTQSQNFRWARRTHRVPRFPHL